MKIQKRTNVLFRRKRKMNALIISVLEVLMVGFTVWCLFNEKKLVAFEKRIIRAVRRRKFKIIKGGKNISKHYA